MILKLDPRWPLTWRSTTSMQFGVDPPIVVLDDVTEADERMLAALAVGVSRPGLELIGKGDTDALLDQLGRVLLSSQPIPRSGTVAITGSGPFVAQLASTLGHHGMQAYIATSAADFSDVSPDLAITVAHYVVAPELRGYWLRRDVPHLPVLFSDTGVTLGPIVVPGAGACLVCLELHRRDEDPAWPAVATQLLGRRGSASHAVLVSETVGAVGRLVLGWFGHGEAAGGASVRIDAETGERTTRSWERHPECGCAEVPSAQLSESAQVGQKATSDALSSAAGR